MACMAAYHRGNSSASPLHSKEAGFTQNCAVGSGGMSSVTEEVTLARVSLAPIATRDRDSTGCSLPPYHEQVRNTPATSRCPHFSPGNTLRRSHFGRYLPSERWSSSAGKTASQQREDKVVALEIITSTAIQINPLAAESRHIRIVPQGAGRAAASPNTDAAFPGVPVQSCQQHTQTQAVSAAQAHSCSRAGNPTPLWNLKMDLSPLKSGMTGRSKDRPCSKQQ